MTLRIVFRTDSSFTLGVGHLFRCLTLADALRRRDSLVCFVCADIPGNLIQKIEEKGYVVNRLPASNSGRFGIDAGFDAERTIETLVDTPNTDWLIVDHYGLDVRWERRMRTHTGKIMVIDDLADRCHDCDILLDQNLYDGLDRRYEGKVPGHCETLLGPRYALLRPEFAAARRTLRARDGRVQRILIFFGGTDMSDETSKALDAIRLMNPPDIIVDVVVGASNPRKERIRETCREMRNVNFHCQVENMADLMSLADLAIGAGGTSTWERCFLGLPSMVLVLADNQRELVEAMSARGAMNNVGWHDDVTSTGLAEELRKELASPDRLKAMSALSLAVMGGPDAVSGAEIVVDRLVSAHAAS